MSKPRQELLEASPRRPLELRPDRTAGSPRPSVPVDTRPRPAPTYLSISPPDPAPVVCAASLIVSPSIPRGERYHGRVKVRTSDSQGVGSETLSFCDGHTNIRPVWSLAHLRLLSI